MSSTTARGEDDPTPGSAGDAPLPTAPSGAPAGGGLRASPAPEGTPETAAASYRDTGAADGTAHSLLAWLQQRLPTAVEFAAQVGYVTTAGLRLIEGDLTALLNAGGRVHLVVGAAAEQIGDEEIRRLADWFAEYPGRATLTVVDGRDRMLHAKSFLVADGDGTRHALVGSGNLTLPGMTGNIEAAVALTAPANAPSPALDGVATAIAGWRSAPRTFAVTPDTVAAVLRSPGRLGHALASVRRSRTRILAEPTRRLHETLPATMDVLDRIASRGGVNVGVPTGFRDLDDLTNGLQAGQLVLIAGRPGQGKSVLAMDLARAAAVRYGLPTALFSLEMSTDELNMRLLAAQAKVQLHHMRSGSLDDQSWARLAGATGTVADAPLFVNDSTYLTVDALAAEATRIKQRAGLRLLIVDYLQLLTSSRRTESRQQEVSEFSRGLKLLARELEVPVVAVSQLNRGPEARADRRPQLADLRESGGLEQDSDLVLLVHRPDTYEPESPRAGEADLILAKQRNGPTATVTVAFQGHYSRFVDMA